MAKKKALVVGVSDYERFASSLPGAAADLKGWLELLDDQGFDTTPLSNPEKADIVDALKELVAGDGDRNVFVFAGHGTYVPPNANKPSAQGLVAYVPEDVPANEYEEYVLFDYEFVDIIGGLGAGAQLTAILDCCNAAGNASANALAAERLERSTNRARFLSLGDTPPITDQQAAIANGFFRLSKFFAAEAGPQIQEPAVIAATAIDQDAFEDDELDGGGRPRPYGVFSYFAIRALTKDPLLSPNGLVQQTIADVSSAHPTQVPNVPSNSGRENASFLL